jgi:hypothetical protein
LAKGASALLTTDQADESAAINTARVESITVPREAESGTDATGDSQVYPPSLVRKNPTAYNAEESPAAHPLRASVK